MADWNISSVGLTGEQKTAAVAEKSTAKRINLILSNIITNTDAAFNQAGQAVDAKISEKADEINSSVDQKFSDLKASLGTNFSAPDIAGRDALKSLSIGDSCFVADNGDGKWARYEVTDVSGGNTGSTVTWTKIIDQDMLVDVNVDQLFSQIQASISALSATVASNKTAAESDATSKANQALADAKAYADAQDATTLQAAKDYADQKANEAGQSGNEAANQALTDAKAYTDSKDAAARSDLDPSVAAHLGSDADWGIA